MVGISPSVVLIRKTIVTISHSSTALDQTLVVSCVVTSSKDDNIIIR